MTDTVAAPAALLLRRSGFGALWAGDLVSQLGSQITLFVLPLLAVTTLHADGGQVGLLQALYLAPAVVVPLLGGLWLERRAKRPVMITLDLTRAVLVVSIPVLALTGAMSLPLVYVVAFAGGSLSVLCDIASTSYVPHLVPAERLASANGALSANQAVGAAVGPGLAGWLAGAFGPVALFFDGLTYLVSAAALAGIRQREPVPARPDRRDLRRELREGFTAVWGEPRLRALVLHAALYNAAVELVTVGFLVYFVRDLGHSGAAYGVLTGVAGVGAVTGALLAPKLLDRVGYGPAALTGMLFSTTSYALLPSGATVLCGLAFFLATAGAVCTSVVAVTLRQRLTPPELYARVNATYRLLGSGSLPFGAAAAGLVVDALGARTALWIAPVALVCSTLPVLTSSLPRTRKVS
ncbi:MFS transporter [Amycolatopsis sp. NPDC047767]|uniref:MFS transporter n=1 Tax=Amycolatopsis sp. NPDC047767 TaxID=3156765 RepID=UPI0034560EAB